MKTSSAKAKGRRLTQRLRDKLLAAFPVLCELDLVVTPSSCFGEDIQMSKLASDILNIAIECKNQEKLNIWQTIEQVERHSAKSGKKPFITFSRNRMAHDYSIMRCDDVINLMSENYNLRQELIKIKKTLPDN